MKKTIGSRRGNGEGSIYQRPDGRWTAVIALPGDSRAKRRRKYIYGKTRTEAVRKKVQALQKAQSGVPLPSDRKTVASLAREWLQSKRTTIKFKTYENYDGLLRNHVEPNIGHTTVSRLEPAHIVKLYADLEEAGLSRRSIGNVHRLLHNMLNQAVRWNYAARNVISLVDPPRYVARQMVTLTPDQARSFLSASKGHRLEALFKLAITTGAREGELLGLSWRDVDLKAGTIRIRESLQRSEGGHSLGTPKTTSSERTIPLTVLAIEALVRHRRRQLEERMKVGSVWIDEGLVFTSQIGTALNPNNFYTREYKPLAAAAGLPDDCRFHDLRHAMASLALSRGMPVTAVSQMLGHANAGTTMRIYAHAIPGSGSEIAKAMDALLA